MGINNLLNEAYEFIMTTQNFMVYIQSTIKNPPNPDKIFFYVPNEQKEIFLDYLEKIYLTHKVLKTKFSRRTVYIYIETKFYQYKRKNEILTTELLEGFFNELLTKEKMSLYVVAPISGIRLDNVDEITIACFQIGKQKKLKTILSNTNDGYYIAVKINDIYDIELAKDEAENLFLDFIRLIIFISGKNDKKILIKIGLPEYASLSHEQMYVATSSYQFLHELEDEIGSININNTYIEKIPLDNDFFCKNEYFEKLFHIFKRKYLKDKISDIEYRLLNASIAIGESASNTNVKNSIIYTSMALEILFSFDEGSLFQKSIGSHLSETFAFIAAKDKETRKNLDKRVKTFYRLRSALVHGGDANINNEYIFINELLRGAIRELLHNNKYSEIKNIQQLYEMVKDAQYSYE